MAIAGRLKVLLDGVVAQMDGAEDHSKDIRVMKVKASPFLLLSVSLNSVNTFVCSISSHYRNTRVRCCCSLFFCFKPDGKAFFSHSRCFEQSSFGSIYFPV